MANPARCARRTAARKSSMRPSISPMVSSRGIGLPSRSASALGPTVGQAGSGPSTASGCAPSQGRAALARRPAWPSWMPGATPCSRYMAAIRAKPSIWPSFHNPVQPWVMRPSRVTAVASTKAAPNPPSANLAWCRKCQSCTAPSTAWYWHIGETTMRLRSSRPRRRSGVNSSGVNAYSAACSRLPSSSAISPSSSRMMAVSLATRSSPSRPSALKVVSGSRTSPTG